MNILFLTLLDFKSINEHNIYTDLLREFVKHSHKLYIVSPVEKKKKINTYKIESCNTVILKLKIGNIQKTNLIEKGISTLTIESIFIDGIKKYFSNVKFDLIIYSTPPITFYKSIEYVKYRDGAKAYLLLKDIFPQNAVDLGILTTSGIKGVVYNLFRKKEKKLYEISDYIGCMSQANVDYIIRHNPNVSPHKVKICPNSIEVIDKSVDANTRKMIRKKYGLPVQKKVFVYGGNLGKPQGIDFLISCIRSQKDNSNVFFLVIGDGTEYEKLSAFSQTQLQCNFKLMKPLPKDDYDMVVGACDVGLIFLDHRFTIPNFPSRLLSYMQAKIPVLACTDPNTDIGRIIVNGGFGWWCESNNVNEFAKIVSRIVYEDFSEYAECSYKMLQNNYSVERAAKEIIESVRQ